jgi:hypothetical protein
MEEIAWEGLRLVAQYCAEWDYGMDGRWWKRYKTVEAGGRQMTWAWRGESVYLSHAFYGGSYQEAATIHNIICSNISYTTQTCRSSEY